MSLTSALSLFLAVLAVPSLSACVSVLLIPDEEGRGGGEWVVGNLLPAVRGVFLPLGVQGGAGLLGQGRPRAGRCWVARALSWNSSGIFFFLVLT